MSVYEHAIFHNYELDLPWYVVNMSQGTYIHMQEHNYHLLSLTNLLMGKENAYIMPLTLGVAVELSYKHERYSKHDINVL